MSDAAMMAAADGDVMPALHELKERNRAMEVAIDRQAEVCRQLMSAVQLLNRRVRELETREMLAR